MAVETDSATKIAIIAKTQQGWGMVMADQKLKKLHSEGKLGQKQSVIGQCDRTYPCVTNGQKF